MRVLDAEIDNYRYTGDYIISTQNVNPHENEVQALRMEHSEKNVKGSKYSHQSDHEMAWVALEIEDTVLDTSLGKYDELEDYEMNTPEEVREILKSKKKWC